MQVASEVKAQKDADNAHAVPIEVPDTRTSAVPQEVPDTMTNAAPGACTEIAQGSSGSPMRVPGRGLRATSGKVTCCSSLGTWILCVYPLHVHVRVSVSVCVCM